MPQQVTSTKKKGAKPQKGTKTTKATKTQPPNWLWVALLGLVILVLAGVWLSQQKGSQVASELPSELSVAQAFEKREAGAFILDVREPDEWAEYHIPDATLISLGDLESRLNELPRDQEIVVVCRSGNRSIKGRDILLNAGFTKVTHMAGGMKAWQAAGYPTETGE